jgi:hypothetical protein
VEEGEGKWGEKRKGKRKEESGGRRVEREERWSRE